MDLIEIELIKKRMISDPVYAAMFETMIEEIEEFCPTFKDDPTAISEWGHHYFCKDDGSPLTHNPDNAKAHECPLCHKVYTSDLLDGVWVYQYRNDAVLTLQKLAVAYRVTLDTKYLDYYKNILGFYVDHYEEFVLHNKEGHICDSVETMEWGCGRLMPQGLNESIILNRIMMSLTQVEAYLDQAFINKIKKEFIPSAYKFLKPQVDKIHNISCWVNSAIGVMGLFAGNEDMITFAFEGELNIRRQLREGVTKDFFWYEGSIHYNFFTLEGVTMLALFAKTYNYKFGIEIDIVENMLVAAYGYAFTNHILPNPNDGWPDVNLKTYSYIYSVGTKIFGYESRIGDILSSILMKDVVRGELPLSKPYYYKNTLSMEQFILLPDFEPSKSQVSNMKSLNYEHSNFALLKNEALNVFLKYGHNSPSHAHPDKMTIEVVIGDVMLTRDLSNAGYGSVICNEWHRTTASHNTIVIDGQDMTSNEPGEVLTFDKDRCHAKAIDVFENVEFDRDIEISLKGYSDVFKAASAKERTYDLMFHSHGSLVTELLCKEGDLNFKTNGYQQFTDVKEVILEDDASEITLIWQLGQQALKNIVKVDGLKMFIAKSPDNPITGWRQTIILRSVSKEAEFKSTWELV